MNKPDPAPIRGGIFLWVNARIYLTNHFLTNIRSCVKLIKNPYGGSAVMKIRFCEFCSNVMREDVEYCTVCGCHIAQYVDDNQFNTGCPWPFTPVDRITLRIQERPHTIDISGTHSLYHLWKFLTDNYTNMTLLYRIRKDEIELASFPEGSDTQDFLTLEPGDILNCAHRRFSCYSYDKADPELELEEGQLEMTYQGTFELTDCPERDIHAVLGLFLATGPKPRFLEGWVFDI